jgi:hypothetical protein
MIDPRDLDEARTALDSEFPGAVYDDSLTRFLARRKKTGRFKKRFLVFTAKFVCFAGLSFCLVSGGFPLSFLDGLTVVAGAAVFALLPLMEYAKRSVKGQLDRI